MTSQLQETFNQPQKYRDLILELIKLGHYDLKPEKIQLAIDTYNSLGANPIYGLDEARNNTIGFFHEERIIAMKEGTMKRVAQKEEVCHV